tara:strand:- start:97 stop:282 length:186 start_codon:yes stop_codon:yes gene_type:complete
MAFIDGVILRAKKMVDPRKYSKQDNWIEFNNGHKLPRETNKGFIDVIIKDQKKKPGPHHYN